MKKSSYYLLLLIISEFFISCKSPVESEQISNENVRFTLSFKVGMIWQYQYNAEDIVGWGVPHGHKQWGAHKW